MTYHTKNYFYVKIKKATLLYLFVIAALVGVVLLAGRFRKLDGEVISPVPNERITPTPRLDRWGYPIDEEGNWIANEDGYYGPLDNKRPHLEGWASWYGTGENECLGCNPERIMANGERLDDNKKTIACNHYPLGTKVLVQNLREDGTGMFTEAVITDRGGFGKYNRVADLSKAVRDAINCGGLCWVRIFPID